MIIPNSVFAHENEAKLNWFGNMQRKVGYVQSICVMHSLGNIQNQDAQWALEATMNQIRTAYSQKTYNYIRSSTLRQWPSCNRVMP